MITTFKIFEGVGRIPRKKLDGIFYHGFTIADDSGLFDELSTNQSDWEAVWVAEEEWVAEEFSDWKSYSDDEMKVVYQIQVKSTGIAEVSYETSQNILDEWAISDFRESIDVLKRMGYRGWITPGSIDRHQYEDIALFYPNEQTKIQAVKLYIDDDWTNFMNFDEAQEIIEKHFYKQLSQVQ
jgi:hypothetical protein